MKILNFNETAEHMKDGSLLHDTDQESVASVIFIGTKDETHNRGHLDTSTYEKFEDLSKQLKRQGKVIFFVVCLNIIFLCTFVVVIAQKLTDDESKSKNNAYTGQDDKGLRENFSSGESMKIVQEQIFCTTCDTIRGIEQQFFETVGTDKCCLKDISSLLQLMKSMDIKNVNEFSTEINVLKSYVYDVKEETNILTKELFNSNKSNDTDIAKKEAPNERIMWSMIKKNNRLLNLVLNRKRSVLYLIGTALEEDIYWSVEVASGDLSYKGNSIHVTSGGHYMIDSNIHFSKNVCDGTENIGYVINQEYRPGEKLPIARARAACATGSKFDEDLRLDTVLQVGLGQRLKLHLQYDKHIQSLISKTYRSHHIIMYEL